MPRINLLPWREAQRKERKLRFVVALGAAAVCAFAVTGAVYLLYNEMIDEQVARNELLKQQIKILDRQIEEINDLEQTKRQFIARMQIIEKLQGSRPEIVHLFDQIVKTLPDGVYLTGVTQSGDHLKFTGVAQSSTRVSTFMRNIDSSQWMKNPTLEVIQSAPGAFGSSFTLDAQETAGDTDTAADGPMQGPKGPRIVANARGR
ncbi:MAG: PilN domain-containing protein [Gammaproteobacteria bacterium]|nr:PilN domain-containing protein [Gammaproteobacteria bacterium]MDE2262835.1 PilN domain-containing protein [Gammaproteobacteria bacterium]